RHIPPPPPPQSPLFPYTTLFRSSKTSRWHARHAAANCAVKSTNASQSSPTLNLPQPRTKQPLLQHDLRNRNCVHSLRMTNGPSVFFRIQRTPLISRYRHFIPNITQLRYR